MKIFVTCQKDAFNKSCDGIQKRYAIGQALIDAYSVNEDIILIMETHRTGKYCVYNNNGWELIDELQAVIDVLDDEHINKLIAIESPTKACFNIIPAVQEISKSKVIDIEFIGPLLDENILHNIILIYNSIPNAKISISLKRCGCTKKDIRESVLKILVNMGVIIKDL